MTLRLPDFPWDTLTELADLARTHPDGIVDLSVGTPVDPTPLVVQQALRDHADAPGYPTTVGLPDLANTCRDWLRRSLGVTSDVGVLPTIGSKEMVAWLPTGLGMNASSVIVIPSVAYPTYEVGALVAGAQVVATDDITSVPEASMIWLNTPSNPTGRVLRTEWLSEIVSWARERGIVVVSDECYIELGWDATPVSILHPDVNGGNVDGLLAIHSLSKRSSMAGYRFGFVAGDPAIVAKLLATRKHLGMMVPAPVQHAAIAAYADDHHVAEQRQRYGARRTALREALLGAGFTIDDSEAGLYLWATRGEGSWPTARWFAERGILVAPGTFYGDDSHVRVALTATDERINAAVTRLA